MKKLLFFPLAFAALILTTSCGDDEGPATFEIDGEAELAAFDLNGYIIDEGSTFVCGDCKQEGNVDNARKFTFLITDGEYTFDADGFITDFVDGPEGLWFEVETYSMGTDADFEEGDFAIHDYYYYNDCGIPADFTVNHTSNIYAYWSDDTYYYGEKSGTVNITGSETKFKMVWDGVLYDWNSEGTDCNGYDTVPVSGTINMPSTFISEEVWNATR